MRKADYHFSEVSLEKAQELLKQHVSCQRNRQVETVGLMEALGRIAAQDYRALISQPPFHRSPLDGYALRAEDIAEATKESPISLRVVEEIMAGDFPVQRIMKGSAARIMTGAPIPEGADCVVMQEHTDYGEKMVQIYQPQKAWSNICFMGEDFQQGDCLVVEGTKLSAIQLGILASMGYAEVLVYKKPRIALFTTGDELMMPGQRLKPGKIYNSNLPVLWGRLKELGIEPVFVSCLADEEKGAAAALEKILPEVDVIITTGGVSVGKKDIMHGALELLGADKIFWRVGIKPGSPTIFAVAKDVAIIALSGNPFGAAVNLELLVRPVLAQMTGDHTFLLQRKTAVMTQAFEKESRVRRFLRGIYQDGIVRLPKGLHSSGVLGSMQGCNCLIDIPAGSKGISAGETVEVVLLK